jgi:hypothetical protein
MSKQAQLQKDLVTRKENWIHHYDARRYRITPCTVYILKATILKKPVKIGISINLVWRLNSFQAGSPLPLEIVAGIKCSSIANAQIIETKAHQELNARRVWGEWFAIESDVALKALKYIAIVSEIEFQLVKNMPIRSNI